MAFLFGPLFYSFFMKSLESYAFYRSDWPLRKHTCTPVSSWSPPSRPVDLSFLTTLTGLMAPKSRRSTVYRFWDPFFEITNVTLKKLFSHCRVWTTSEILLQIHCKVVRFLPLTKSRFTPCLLQFTTIRFVEAPGGVRREMCDSFIDTTPFRP